MSKVYLTCFEFTLGPISAYKRSVTPTHWQKLRNFQGSKKWISDTQNPKFCFSLKIECDVSNDENNIHPSIRKLYLMLRINLI